MSLTKKAQVNLFLSLSSFVVVFLGSLIGVCFLVQIRVRNMIRDDRHSVNPVSMTEDGAAGKMLVRDRDLFLFCFRNGLIAPARRPDTFYDFMGRMLCDFPVGTNRIFILADTLCSKRVVEEKMEDLCGKCSNEVYLVGKSFDLEADLVCERWKGSWAAMRLIGIGVDCSVIDRLFYISPFVCNPLLGWFGDRCGCVYDVQKPWRDKKGMRLLHGFKDGFESLNVEH